MPLKVSTQILWPCTSTITARRAGEVAALAQSGQLACTSAKTPKSIGGSNRTGSGTMTITNKAASEEVEDDGIEDDEVEGDAEEEAAAAVAADSGSLDRVSATTLSVPAI
jgi:hypothetical protein